MARRRRLSAELKREAVKLTRLRGKLNTGHPDRGLLGLC
jgi:hypothetical protein